MSHNRDLSAAAGQFGFHSSNIGISSEAPRYPLDVHGGNILVSGSAAANLILEDRGVGDSSRPFALLASNDGNFTITSANRNASGTTTSSAERLRITSAGRMGVGCTPETDFQVRNGNGGTVKIGGSGSGATGFQIQYNNSGFTTTELLTNYRSTSGSASLKIDTGTFLVATGTSGTERLRITSDGNMGLGVSPSYSGVFGGSQRVLHIGGTTAPGLRIQSSTSNQGDFIIQAGNSGGATYLSNLSNNADTVFFNTSGGSISEKVRITHDGVLQLRRDNSGGVGPYLSIQNRGTATGTRTGISFSVGNSGADLNGSDYGEAEIHVYRDGGGHGNFDFRCHTGANRSWLKIIGNGQNEGGAAAGTEGMRGGVAFGCAGIAIDRSWYGQPGIHVFNQNVEGDTDQGTFRFHGWNRSYASYPGSSGSDFGVNVVGDGSGFSSDERKKTGITTITNALNTVSQMRGVSYQFVNSELTPQTHMTMDNGTKLGFIAQEVIPLLPSVVIDAGGERAVPHENGWCDRYAIDYGSVTALLVEAIKELKADKEALEARIAALEGS